ncbi:MAG: hypothetical protein IKB98_07990, partial [Clostridia bacterium]|nr:hypothetical protein [Clostridia bacterium]
MDYDVKAGFSRVNITPPLGIDMWGYFIERKATGILDELEINTIVIEKNGKRVFLLSVDTCGLYKEFINKAKDLINKELDIDKDSLFIHSTHTHTGGSIGMPVNCPIVSEFNNTV